MVDRIDSPYRTKWQDKFKTSIEVSDLFRIHILYHSDIKESQDLIVYYGEKKDENRVGWLIPLSRFSNDIHKAKSNDQKFLEAYMSAAIDLINIQHRSKMEKWFKENEDKLSIEVFFEEIFFEEVVEEKFLENIMILVEHIESSDKCGFDFDRCKVLLYLKYNLFVLTSQSDPNFEININSKGVETNELIIPGPSQYFDVDDKFLYEVLPMIYEESMNNQFLKFSVLYQIIEYLMEDIVDTLIMYLIKEKQKTFDLKNDINEKLSESGRIKEIINHCTKIRQENIEAMLSSTETIVLRLNPSKKPETLPKRVYFLRNTLFHSLREVISIEGFNDMLTEINKNFENILVDMISTYSNDHYS